MASETSDMLDDRVEWCAADVPIPQMENLYEKISQLFDLVMEQMPLTSYMPKKKEKHIKNKRLLFERSWSDLPGRISPESEKRLPVSGTFKPVKRRYIFP